WNLSWYVADPRTGTLSEVALKQSELDAAQTDPVIFPTPDTNISPKGPSWVQIGTEGGFLPAPVVVPAHEMTWITDPTRFDVGNADQHSLLLAPAERADVIVDFSQFRGKTLILYNDAPAAFPARVPGYDYYTGGPDLSPAGAPTTLPGYGPNTRTIMQVKVSNAAPAVAFDRPNTTADRMGALLAAFAHHLDANGNPAGVFESGSDPIIVGQADYNGAYGTNFVGSGWCNSPTNPSAKCDGYARIAEGSQPTDNFKFDTLSGNQLSMKFQPKGLHDEMNSANFDEWGRMTANLGLEAPGATPLLQNIILYPYVNPATEILDSSGMPSSLKVTPISSAADGTQIWKITHNGVDTHPIHWHLYDVQVLNRVTWDNIIIPPEPTELGWKETVRVSPLEDTIVALRPIVPTLPFAVPDSVRPLNPMMPLGARGDVNGPNGTEAGFNNTDTNGNPIDPIVNSVQNFGWEYVFHCHILSHEEMDMMRPVTVKVPWLTPDAPVLSFTRGSVILNWTDGTPVNYL
ncbi:MAG TPA: multicopper oxidase domain-containing protein, partial [Ilumatobacteraceae bacterium]|nr:multicopper oxidase domain-containing protein [Ilumatobacteraceae bacterium]